MFRQSRWSPAATLPIIGGLVWLWLAASFGVLGFLFSVIPGCLLLASGVSILLWPGDTRILSFTAVGGLLGLPLALPAFYVAGPGMGMLLIGLSAASFLAAGALAVRWEPHTPNVPAPEPALRLSAEVAADEVMMAYMQTTLPIVSGDAWRRICAEVIAASELFEERGWLEEPRAYHAVPPELEGPSLEPARIRGIDYEHLSFESDYEPHADEPGRERWLSYKANRVAHAWVVRHPGPPRPWLVAINGFQTGTPLMDLLAFDPRLYVEQLGMNMICPVLPLHGRRKEGRRSGDGFLAGDVLDTVHAEAQAMWDIRRILSWVRGQGAPAVGVFGVSLGGYQAALLAGLDGGIACSIAGIPLTDIPRVFWRHGPPLLIRHGEHHGVQRDQVSEVMSVVSPLSLEPRIPRERRYIFAGVCDRIVPADQPHDLWEHWERPRMAWHQGGHLTTMSSPAAKTLLRDALAQSGLSHEAGPRSA